MFEQWLAQFPWATNEFAGLEMWMWVVLPGLFFGIWAVTRILVAAISGIGYGLTKRKEFYDNYIRTLNGPAALFLTAMAFNAAQALLPLEETTQANLDYLNTALYTVAVTWGLLKLTQAAFDVVKGRLQADGRIGAAAIIPLLRKLTKTTVVALAVLFTLQNWGFDVAAIIAALGIGGVALALASQKSVENIFGGVMVSLDQPIRVGDFGKFGDFVGTVEDIGLRSTRIRTLGRTIISVPNSDMASMQIESFAPRDKILLQTTLGLRYETTADQMRFVLMQIKELLLRHPMIDNTPARARFVSFNDYSLDIEIFAYIKTSDWNEFLEVKEDLFLRIKDIVEEAGSDFAFPSQTMYFERGGGLDEKLQGTADKQVKDLRKKGELQWPQFTDDRTREVTDTLDYPPKDAAIVKMQKAS